MKFEEISLETAVNEILTNDNSSVYIKDYDQNFIKIILIEIGFDFIEIRYSSTYTIEFTLDDIKERNLIFYKKC